MKKLELPSGALKILKNEQDYFFKKDIPVLNRLIVCRDKEFIDAFFKIDFKIKKHNPINLYTNESHFDDSYMGQWMVFLDIFVSCSTDFNVKNAISMKEAKKIFEKKLSKISKLASSLADEMNELAVYGEKHGLSEDAEVHPLELLNQTVDNQADPETLYRYNSKWREGISVRDLINHARTFDLKYFPSIPEIINEIAVQYSKGCIVFDSVRATSQVGKINTFCDHFFSNIQHHIENNHLPDDVLKITQSDLASLFRVVLGNEAVDIQDIKNYKQSQKNK